MKICKNNLDIILYPKTKCSGCDFTTRTTPCLWPKIVGSVSFDCGGIRINRLSDIFKV